MPISALKTPPSSAFPLPHKYLTISCNCAQSHSFLSRTYIPLHHTFLLCQQYKLSFQLTIAHFFSLKDAFSDDEDESRLTSAPGCFGHRDCASRHRNVSHLSSWRSTRRANIDHQLTLRVHFISGWSVRLFPQLLDLCRSLDLHTLEFVKPCNRDFNDQCCD